MLLQSGPKIEKRLSLLTESAKGIVTSRQSDGKYKIGPYKVKTTYGGRFKVEQH